MLEAVQPSDVPAVDASPALAPKRAAGLPRPVLEMLLRRCRTWLQEEEESARHRTLPGMSSDKQPADAVVAAPSDVFIQSRTVGSMPSERSSIFERVPSTGMHVGTYSMAEALVTKTMMRHHARE